jgi:antitoxin MazE
VREEGNRIIIEPVRTLTADLANLLAGISDENLHAEVGFGSLIGTESL